MNKQYKDFHKKEAKNARMASINVPDIDKIRKLNDPVFRGQEVNRTADEIFNGEKLTKPGTFERATKIYYDPSRLKKDEEKPEENFDDFEDESVKRHREREAERKSKPFGGKLKKILISVFNVAVLATAWAMFFPPFMSENTDKACVLYDENIFENMGLTEFKTYALSNYSIWKEEAFSSENPDNYRVVSFSYTMKNPTPFEVRIGNFRVSNTDAMYTDKICCCYLNKLTEDNTVAPEIIPAFSSEEVEVRVIINIADMDDKAFDRAVDGLTISTENTVKKFTENLEIPCLPNFDLVSNVIALTPNPQ